MRGSACIPASRSRPRRAFTTATNGPKRSRATSSAPAPTCRVACAASPWRERAPPPTTSRCASSSIEPTRSHGSLGRDALVLDDRRIALAVLLDQRLELLRRRRRGHGAELDQLGLDLVGG